MKIKFWSDREIRAAFSKRGDCLKTHSSQNVS